MHSDAKPKAKVNVYYGEKLLIGAAESIDMPEWGVSGLPAKIDTGARTSALHVEDIVLLGKNRVRFTIVLDHHHREKRKVIEARIVRKTEVKPTSGAAEARLVVETVMRLGPLERPIEVSLTSRGEMRYLLLLGRTAYKGDVIIDPGRRYVATARVRPKESAAKKAGAKKKAPAAKAAKRPAVDVRRGTRSV